MDAEPLPPTNTLTVTAISRAKRIAFLVDKDRVANGEVNDIIRYCSTRWGGRFSPIIPTDGDGLPDDWWQLLVAVDPDIIVSLVAVSDRLVAKINRSILPVTISETTLEERSRFGRRGGIDTGSISAISTHDIPRYLWKSRAGLFEPAFIFLKDSGGERSNELREFVLRNFGLLSGDMSTAQMYRDVEHRAYKLDELGFETIFASAFVPRPKRPIFPIDLSHHYAAPSYSIDYQHRVEGFHLVVGDSPWEAIYHWNLAMHERGGGGRDSLWLPTSSLENPSFLKLVGEWINDVYWGENSNKRGFVVSYTVPPERLSKLAAEIGPPAYTPFVPKALEGPAYPFPRAFAKIDRHRGRLGLFERLEEPRTEHVSLAGESALVQYFRPHFFEREEPNNGWMVDLGIEYRPERYFYTNVRPRWRLPKRVGVPQQFVEQGGKKGRVVANGFPSFEVQAEDKALKIKIPSDRDVIWISCFDLHYSNTTKEHRKRPSQFDHLATSDKGRYLRGVVQLFGSLFHAAHFFEDPFWRAIANTLSSRDDSLESARKRTALTVRALEESLAARGEPLAPGSPNLQELAEHIAQRLTFRDNEGRSITFGELKAQFYVQRHAALQKNSNNSYWKANKKFDAWREREFNGLLAQNVLIQGLELRCPHCNTTQWRNVDDLSSSVECEGCVTTFRIPANPKWAYRLNSLIGNAIRYHGTVPVLMALNHIEHYVLHIGTMLYLPCQDVIKRRDRKRTDDDDDLGLTFKDGMIVDKNDQVFTDLDLVLVGDGRITIGEVKSEPSGFKPDDFEKLRTVALDFLPDEVVLAAKGDTWPPEVLRQMDSFTADLASVDVRVRSILLAWPD